MDVIEKKYLEKRLLKMFLTEDKVLMEYKDTDQSISVRFLTLLIFAVGSALCGRPQSEHESVIYCCQFLR